MITIKQMKERSPRATGVAREIQPERKVDMSLAWGVDWSLDRGLINSEQNGPIYFVLYDKTDAARPTLLRRTMKGAAVLISRIHAPEEIFDEEDGRLPRGHAYRLSATVIDWLCREIESDSPLPALFH